MAQVAAKTCDICVSASGSQYCLDCDQYFCDNCKVLHNRQRISKGHKFQSAWNVPLESKSKCKDHNEDVSFVCNTCMEAVCSSCVTGRHNGHRFSKLIDNISQLKEKNKIDLRRKVHEATQNMTQLEEGLKVLEMNVEEVVKSITDEGTTMKVMVDKCVAEIIASVKSQFRKEKDKLTKTIADTKIDLTAANDLNKKITELDKTRNDRKLLQSLQKLADKIAKLTIEPRPEMIYLKFTTGSTTDSDIKEMLGTFDTCRSVMRGRQNRRMTKEVIKPLNMEPYEQLILYQCKRCGREKECTQFMEFKEPILVIDECQRCTRRKEMDDVPRFYEVPTVITYD